MSSKNDKKPVHPQFEMFTGRAPGQKLVLGDAAKIPLRPQIFPEEWLALKYLKEQCFVCKHSTDEFLFACLWARKMDIGRTIDLVERNWKWRLENGFEEIPRVDDITWEYANVQLMIPGSRTKKGEAITYMFAGQLEPSKMSLEETVVWMVWYFHVGQFYSGMDAVRNGVYLVNDNASYGWKNFDLTYLRTISDLFQFKVSSYDDLASEIAKDNLWTHYGGEVKGSIPEFIEMMKDFGRWWEYQHDPPKIPGRKRAGTLRRVKAKTWTVAKTPQDLEAEKLVEKLRREEAAQAGKS